MRLNHVAITVFPIYESHIRAYSNVPKKTVRFSDTVRTREFFREEDEESPETGCTKEDMDWKTEWLERSNTNNIDPYY